MKISTMKTKGVAVQTIIMVMLGIIVLLFVGYWLVRVFTTPGLSQEECRTLLIDWCRTCSARGWDGTAYEVPSALTACLNRNAAALNINANTIQAGLCSAAASNECAKVGVLA